VQNAFVMGYWHWHLAVFEQIEGEMSLVELMALLNRKARTQFRQQVLAPLIELDLIEATIPDKPPRSRQTYRPDD